MSENPDANVWACFCRRHEGHPFLAADPIYALKADVVTAIRLECPSFFSDADEKFERDLAETTHHGFFQRRPIGGFAPLLEIPRCEQSDMTLGQRESELLCRQVGWRMGGTIGDFLSNFSYPLEWSQRVHERLAPILDVANYRDRPTSHAIQLIKDLLLQFRSTENREAFLKRFEAERHLMQDRQESYAGWLIVNSRYRSDVESLRTIGADFILRSGAFPDFNGLPESNAADGLLARYKSFLDRWCLGQLLTWDLPVPRVVVASTSDERARMRSDDGICLSLPWYVLRGEQLNLQHVVQRIRAESTPDHLREWVFKTRDDHEGEVGDRTYQRIFWIYRTLTLALQLRYSGKCKKNVAGLDRAMALVMGRDADLVKKLRLQMTKSLRRAERPASS